MLAYSRLINGEFREIWRQHGGYLDDYAPRIRELAGQGLYDWEIGTELDLSAAQVYNQRKRHGIPAAHRRGRPRKAA